MFTCLWKEATQLWPSTCSLCLYWNHIPDCCIPSLSLVSCANMFHSRIKDSQSAHMEPMTSCTTGLFHKGRLYTSRSVATSCWETERMHLLKVLVSTPIVTNQLLKNRARTESCLEKNCLKSFLESQAQPHSWPFLVYNQVAFKKARNSHIRVFSSHQ